MGNLARWRLRHMKFAFKVIHRAVEKQQAVDALSRLSTNVTADRNIDDEIPLLAILQQSRKEERQILCSCQDCDDVTVNSKPHQILTAEANDVELSTIADFVLAKRKDAFCNQMKQLARTPNCLFTFDKNGLLVSQASLDQPIHKLVPNHLSPIILYLAHHSTSAGHPANAECTTPYVAITTDLTLPMKSTIQLYPAWIFL